VRAIVAPTRRAAPVMSTVLPVRLSLCTASLYDSAG
jgi:hypothetical protein